MNPDKKSETKKGTEILTTEQCSRCRHPIYKNTSTGEKVCRNCGLKAR